VKNLAHMDSITKHITHTWNGHNIPPTDAIDISLERLSEGLFVHVHAPFYNNPPPLVPAGSCEGLWEYEVVELFLANGENYTELELGPHGHYLLLRLKGVRKAHERGLKINFESYISGDNWHGEAKIPWDYLPPEPWHMNAYAIHGVGSERRYLALYGIPEIEPDFHQLDCFKLLDWKT
jgi:hypothetical protein